MTPNPLPHGYKLLKHCGTINLFLIRETTSMREVINGSGCMLVHALIPLLWYC